MAGEIRCSNRSDCKCDSCRVSVKNILMFPLNMVAICLFGLIFLYIFLHKFLFDEEGRGGEGCMRFRCEQCENRYWCCYICKEYQWAYIIWPRWMTIGYLAIASMILWGHHGG